MSWRDGTTHSVMLPMQFMERLAMLVTPTHATATGNFMGVNLVGRIPGLGRLPGHTTDC